jgi:hypothetical protein
MGPLRLLSYHESDGWAFASDKQVSFREVKLGYDRLFAAVCEVITAAHEVQQTARNNRSGGRRSGSKGRTTRARAPSDPELHLWALSYAFVLTQFLTEQCFPALDWLDRLILKSRSGTVQIDPSRRCASAFRFVRQVSTQLRLPFNDDTDDNDDFVDEYGLIGVSTVIDDVFASDPSLGKVVNEDGNTEYLGYVSGKNFDSLWLHLRLGAEGIKDYSDFEDSSPFTRLGKALASNRSLPKELLGVQFSSLAEFLSGLASVDDLLTVREELVWEFSQVTLKNHELVPPRSLPIPVVKNAESRIVDGPDSADRARADPRGEYAYRLLMEDIPLKTALTRFNAEAEKQGWEEVGSHNGVKYIAKCYAAKRRLTPIPSRKPD